MTTAIAAQLQSITDTELVELGNADVYWQQIRRILATPEATYLIFPQTTTALAKIVQAAAQQQWRILICGNATKIDWGKNPQNIQLIISTQKCDRLVEHAVGDLTVTVEAGMKLVDLQAKLRSHQQFLPIDTNYPDATLGGIVATADAGSWRQRYGGVRDLLLGLSFVRADGEIAKAGGRVVKNVAGYDLMKLFTGAYGTLGIMTQLTFRTYPLIATSQTLLLTGKAPQIAQATQTIRNSGLTPTAMDLLSASVVQQLDLGCAHGLVIRWQTIPESIEQQRQQVEAIAKQLELDSKIFQGDSEAKLWQDCSKIVNLPQSTDSITCKVGIAPTAASSFLEQYAQISDQLILGRIHASSGLGRLQLTTSEVSKPEILEQMRSHCQQHQGFLTILDAPSAVKQQIDVWGYSGNALKTMAALKNQFDPQNILNPGRFIV